MDAGGGAIGASGPMLARQKRWAAAFSLPFRKTGVGGSRGGNDLRVAGVCGRGLMMVAGFSSDFSVPGERAPFGLIDGLIWPKTRYASID
jgi:hypothetical protein